MNDEAIAVLSTEAARLLEIWAHSMSQVLGQVSGSDLEVQLASASDADTVANLDSDLNICVVLDGSLRGEMNLRIPRAVALHWAQILMAESPDPGKNFGPEYNEAIEELLRQIAGHVATSMKAHFGQCQIVVHAADAPTWSIAARAVLKSADENHWALEAQLSAALLASLRPQPTAADVSNASSTPSARNLDLLLDVELSLKLRFGQRRMLLKEILDLNSGAIVELDRDIQEPVELLLDDKLIARGTVVVVDGNFGVRLTELAAGL
jgi:flagellar motor switch protein FliN